MKAWDFAERAHRPTISGTRHVVSSGHYLAAQAGFQILEAGGNAIDAGVATGIALNVVEGQMCSFAGVAPTMIYLRETGEIVTLDGLGTWPKAASCEFFRGRGDTVVPEGILQSVVPGAPDAWLTALERYGTMRFAEVAASAIRFARDGYPMHPQMALTLARKRADFPPGSEPRASSCPAGACRRRARSSSRAISPTRCSSLPMSRARQDRAGARPGSTRCAEPSIAATSLRRSPATSVRMAAC